MLHLLDTNVLIDADRDYYPLDMVPEFWEWLCHQGEQGLVKMPLEMFEEVKAGTGQLSDWAKDADVEKAILLNEEAAVGLVQQALHLGYSPSLTDVQIEGLGRDPFLIAYCLADPGNRCVVTTEASRPSRQPHNRHLPDSCRLSGIPSMHTFELVRALNFKTSWKR